MLRIPGPVVALRQESDQVSQLCPFAEEFPASRLIVPKPEWGVSARAEQQPARELRLQIEEGFKGGEPHTIGGYINYRIGDGGSDINHGIEIPGSAPTQVRRIKQLAAVNQRNHRMLAGNRERRPVHHSLFGEQLDGAVIGARPVEVQVPVVEAAKCFYP